MKVLITGGAKRLGREIAKAFADKGAKLVIHYNTSEPDAEIPANYVKADVRDINQIEAAVTKAVEFLGGMDILINNAAIFYKTPLAETNESQWNDFLDINLRAPFFFAKFAAPFLKKSHPGRIINISDTYGFSPAAGYVPYGVSKAGLIAMTKGLAKELAPDVLVNCICPGSIAEFQAIDKTLLKHLVTLDDIIKTVLFLAENNSITGQAIPVDGGKSV